MLLVTGLTLVAVWLFAQLHRAINSRAAIAEFFAKDAIEPSNRAFGSPDPVLGMPVDFRLWSAKRIAAYEDSLAKKADAPLAILRIPKINLEVPIFNDTDDLTLNRGVGRILGTAQIGTSGNLGIAGHRDGFFRGLKDIGAGDYIEILRPGGTDRYAVSQVQIVTPAATHVLNAVP